MKRRIYALMTAAALVSFAPSPASAGLALYPGLRQITAESSHICAGSVRDVHLVRPSKQETKWVSTATFAVDHVIKGVLPSDELRVPLEEIAVDKLPGDMSSQVRGKRWILFLRANSAPSPSFTLVGGLHGMILVSPDVPSSFPTDNDPEAHLECELLASLASDNPVVVGQSMALLEEWGRNGANVLAALQSLSAHADAPTRGQAIATRLSLGDLSALPLALSYRGPEDTMNQIRASIASVSDPRAIPELVTMARADNVCIRRGAMYALRMFSGTGTSSQLAAIFRAALDDPDRDVQYNAGMGLGKLTGGASQGAALVCPARDEFDREPGKYVNSWKSLSSGK